MPIMTQDEIDRLLSKMALVRIATTNEDGSPLVVPTAYLYRDREVLVTAREKVGWLANIRRDPRVCLCIDLDRYPLSKVTIHGRAEIRFEPGRDEEWRDRRLPLAGRGPLGPDKINEDGTEEWLYDAAYQVMTHDEPRALVVVSLEGAKVTSWRMPLEGEYVGESWPDRYYKNEPRKFRVIAVGKGLRDVRVVAE
jgi:Pyridoxamine 5'-phosphate oxidase